MKRTHALPLTLALAAACAHTGQPASGLPHAAQTITATTDSFAIRLNGERFGVQVTGLAPDGTGGYRFTETTTTPAATQSTEVLLGRGLEMRRVTQRGQTRGQEMRIDVSYEGGRATGHARTPGRDGMQDVVIATDVPVGAVDDNVLALLIPLMGWAPGTTLDVPVFQSGRNLLEMRRFRAVGAESVTIPAGRFDALRVESVGTGTPLTFFIAAAPPHALLRIELPGTPMDVVRLNPPQ